MNDHSRGIMFIFLLAALFMIVPEVYATPVVYGSNGPTIYSYDAETGDLVNSFSGGATGLVFGTNDLLYAVAGGNIQAYEPSTGVLVHSFSANFSNSSDIAFSPPLRAVPEPATILLLITGLIGLFGMKLKAIYLFPAYPRAKLDAEKH